MLANIYLDVLDKELEKRGHTFCRYADDRNIYLSSESAAQRVLENITEWIEKNLKLQINVDKSGIGQVWERKFLGFQLNQKLKISVAKRSLERLKDKVRQMWRSCQSASTMQLRDRWRQYIQGWWGYFRLAEDRRMVFGLEPWIRRHIRKCFWLRWHGAEGRKATLKRLGLKGRQLDVAYSNKGAWRIAKSPSLHIALSNAVLKRYDFVMPSDLATR